MAEGEFGHFGGAADVLFAVFGGEAEIAVEAVAQVVAVEEEGAAAQGEESTFQRFGDGGFARSGKAGEPEDGGFVAVEFLAHGAGDARLLPGDVTGLAAFGFGFGLVDEIADVARGRADHAGGDGVVGGRVHKDEAAGAAVDLIGVEEEWVGGGKLDTPDFVEFQRVGLIAVHGIDVDFVVQLRHKGAHAACGVDQPVDAAGVHGFFVHPAEGGVDLAALFGQVAFAHNHVPAADVDFVFQGEDDGIADAGFVHFAVEGDDRADTAADARWQHDNVFAGADAPGSYLPGETAEVLIGADDCLHREAEVNDVAAGADVDRLQVVEQGSAVVPGHVEAFVYHVVALKRREGDEDHVVDVEFGSESLVVVYDALIDFAVVVHQVHFVDGDDKVGDLQKCGQKAVTFGLGEHAFAGVNKDNRQFRRGCAGDHVAGVLDVSWRVGDDEFAFGRGKVAVGHVDGNPLLAF